MELDLNFLYERGFLKQEDFLSINEIFEGDILQDFSIDKLRQQSIRFKHISYEAYKRKNNFLNIDELLEEIIVPLEYVSLVDYSDSLKLKREINSKKTHFKDCFDLDKKEIGELVLISHEIERRIKDKYKETILYDKFIGFPGIETDYFISNGNMLDIQIGVFLNLS